jgi:uncharacterized protein YaaN involved in tellurite resistance
MVTGSPTAPVDAAGSAERLTEQVAGLERECGRLRVRHEDLTQRIAALEAERAHLQRQLVERDQQTAADTRHEAVLDRLADASVSEQAVRKRLDEALATIAHMQQSRFWKIRTAMASVRKIFS